MRYEKKGFDKAFDFVKSKSDIIDPNAGFLIQLQNFDSQLAKEI